MRLDHLLSKEQSKVETQRIHPMVDAVNSKEFTDHKLPTGQIKHGNRVAERAEFPRGRSVDAQRRIGSCLRLRFESVSLSGFGNKT